MDAIRQFVYLSLAGRDVVEGDVSQAIAPPAARSILPADDYQFVGEAQLSVELYGQKLVVSKSTGVQPASTRRRRRWTHCGVNARRLEVSRHANVEPQLVQVVWNATTDVTAKRVAYVVVDRLKCVSVRVAFNKITAKKCHFN